MIAGTFGASILIYATEQNNLFAYAALAIVIVASGHALFSELRERRFGVAAWIVTILWAASFTIALAARLAGVF